MKKMMLSTLVAAASLLAVAQQAHAGATNGMASFMC